MVRIAAGGLALIVIMGLVSSSPPSAVAVTCQGKTADVVGTTGNDALVAGGQASNVIAALAGDDYIEGRGSGDMICGDEGKDVDMERDSPNVNDGADIIVMGGGCDFVANAYRGPDGIEGNYGDDSNDGDLAWPWRG